MKIRWIVLMVLCCMTIPHANAQIDKMLYNQWASMEFKQWQFEPDEYYYSRVWRRIVNMPWPLPDIYGWVPGKGYHDRGQWIPLTGIYIPVILNPYASIAGHWDAVFTPTNYVNEKWRQGIGLRTPAAGEAVLYKDESNKQKDYWSQIREQDILTIADRTGTMSGLTGPEKVVAVERQEAIDEIFTVYEEMEDEEMKERLMDEYHALQEQVRVIEKAHMDNARKVVAIDKINMEYKALAKRAKSTMRMQYLQKKMNKGYENLKERNGWAEKLGEMFNVDAELQKVLSLIDFDKL